ncbi:unnamed protein product [Larinioides sclopetarius]|uniref:C2H2-type domain-containing protein n=1 Tax=Larinioides sclopetarius TaxID=280406 RepID=A0AAV1ZSV4_9ARAC
MHTMKGIPLLESKVTSYKGMKISGTLLHFCTYCPYTTIYSSHLTNHLRKHTGERPFACKTCGRTYTRKNNLLYHLNRYKDHN